MRKLVEDIKQQWAAGGYTREDIHGTIQLNAQALGRIEVLEYLLDKEKLTYEEIVEFLSEE